MVQVGRCLYDEGTNEIGVMLPNRLSHIAERWGARWKAIDAENIVMLKERSYELLMELNGEGIKEVVNFAPIMNDPELPKVEGRYTPLVHQLYTAAFITLNPRCYVLNEPRLGKTGSVILAMDWLQRHGHITGGVLVITTYTTMNSVWKRNIQDTLPNASVVTIHGKGKRETWLDEVAEFYVTNYDSVRLSPYAFTDAVEMGRIGAVVVDELTHVGNSSSKRSKAIGRVCDMPELTHVVGLTGSPADNVEAVYGMAKVINPAALPVKSFTGWKNITMWQYGTQTWQWKPKRDVSDTIFSTLQPAVRFKKTEVFDLPPVTEQVRTCVLSPEQAHVLEKLRKEAVAMLENGDEKTLLTAANGGVKLMRALQVVEGTVKSDDGVVVELDNTDRMKTILDVIGETNRKVLIFSPFIAGCERICKAVLNAGISAAMITGAVTGKHRDMILRKFQEENDPRVLVCHPITVGFGTELSAADTMIFSVPLMLGGFVYNQSIERLSSLKQKSKNINIVHIISTTMESHILTGLRENHEQGQLIASFFEMAKEGSFKKIANNA